jgi:hypothetical protein
MGTLTINTTTEQDTRIMNAFKASTNNNQATGADVKLWLVNHLKHLVTEYEKKIAVDNALNTVIPIDPT